MDISGLRERTDRSEITVSELNTYIKNKLDDDRFLSAITVKGEISNFKYHSTGHLYFSLKDDGGQVKAVMFRSSAQRIRFMPEDGMKVIVRASVSVYAQTGSYQLYVTSMQPDGIGALYLAYEQLKNKLEVEGLFSDEYKKPIPRYPSAIGVITSPTGAAVRDIINVTGRRFPCAKVYLYPALVQGAGAEGDLVKALDYFNESRLVDVIIIGRGGGSIEDLWAFNSEKLARKIFECGIPVISAVGHETDFTICDFVADLRAPTPSAAAEIAVPDIRDLILKVDSSHERILNALRMKADRCQEKLDMIKDMQIFKDPGKAFDKKQEDISDLRQRLNEAISRKIEYDGNRLAVQASKADALSPLSTLARGYSFASVNGRAITGVDAVSKGDSVSVRVHDGELECTVIGKKRLKGERKKR